MSIRSIFFAAVLITGPAMAALAETQLVMVEEKGCIWCARWNDEIADIYPKTAEGKMAPLRRMDIHATRPDDLEFKTSLHFTPTFVLFVDGREVSRLEGYPGEDFFWGVLGKMLSEAEIETTGS